MRSTPPTIAALVSTAPAAGAAYNQPYPRAPTCSTSCAKIGSSAVADEKNVAKKSSSIVDRISGDLKTKRRPSSAACSDTSSLTPGADGWRAGTSRIINSATMTKANEIALATYTQPTPAAAIRIPPSDGPTTDAVWNMIVLRLIALGRCSRGTSDGTSALRAGRSNAPTAAPSAARV